MNANVSALRLQDAWRECTRHVHHLFHAMSALQPFQPLRGDTLAGLDDEQVQVLDQFILRFGKLQDAMGSRLFPAILRFLNEPFEDRPLLDKLGRLEKLGYMNDAGRWPMLRTLRNNFAHDYPDDPDKNAAVLNLALAAALELHAMLAMISSRLQAGFSDLDLGPALPPIPADWDNE